MTAIYIGAAGMLGALARYSLGLLIGTVITPTAASFPYATLLCNLLGSFVLGWISFRENKLIKLSERQMKAIKSGLIGSFTTFSAFSTEIVQLVEGGAVLLAAVYTAVSIGGGLALAGLGCRFGRVRSRGRRTES